MNCPTYCKTIFHYLGWMAILGNLSILLLVIFWLIFPYQLPYVYQPIEILNPNKTIAIGETIDMKIELVKKDNTEALIRPNITCSDGITVPLITKDLSLPIGAHTLLSSAYSLPPVNQGTTCRFNFDVNYQVNPIRDIPMRWSSEEFTVKR
jgi:hypothetical protein